MPPLWVALLLGLVEGLTEFLPVSSTGHLVLVEHFIAFEGSFAKAFEVAIQPGAIAAVLFIYRARFAALVRPSAPGRFGGLRGIALLALVTIPILGVGFAVRGVHDRWLAPLPVAIALGVGAIGIIALERLRGDRGLLGVESLTPRIALGIGLFQCLAVWPGISRSAATIAGGMLLGMKRSAAAEFSFLAAVPALLAAALYKVWEVRGELSADRTAFLATGFAAAALSAGFAVKGFTALLARTDMVPFAWYRLALAAAVLVVLL